MSAVLVVLLGIVFPLLILFVGFFIIIKSKNNETTKSMILGILLSILGALMLLFMHHISKLNKFIVLWNKSSLR